jgi:hypothetical protein
MVAFLTLLLGLTVGVHRIEVNADHRVARVELRLDGKRVALMQGPPWTAECDFGKDLLPHYLEAIALDAQGAELDRVMQRVNLPRDAAEVAFELIGGEHGYEAAQLHWQAADESDPEEILVVFDGVPLEVEGRRVALPRYDARTVHVLTAELVFARQVQARVEVAFGGEYGEKVSSELTAVPLEAADAEDLPSAEELESWLRIGDQPAQVVAVERGSREVVLVRDEKSQSVLRSFGRQAAGSSGPRRSQSTAQRMSAGIAPGDTLRLVGTRPMLVPSSAGHQSALFPVSANLNGPTSGVGFALTNLFFAPTGETTEERVSEAVGVAALTAASSNRARALVLVRSTESDDALVGGGLDPANVRAFVRELRVPFFYWRVGPGADAAADPWGEPKVLRGFGGIHGAITELADSLRPQFLVWVEGLHKPGDITLAGAPAGLRLAGAAAAISAADSRPSRPANPGAAD